MNDSPSTVTQQTMEFTSSQPVQSDPAKRSKKVSFGLPFAKNRNRSIRVDGNTGQQSISASTAMESWPSLAESTSNGRPPFVNLFRSRKSSTVRDDNAPWFPARNDIHKLKKDIPKPLAVHRPEIIRDPPQASSSQSPLELEANDVFSGDVGLVFSRVTNTT
jgi:hypothetical protein